MNFNYIGNLLLRVGVAFAFLYPPFNALSNPESWIGYFPQFVQSMAESAGISNMILLHSFGVVEVLIALWILSGVRIFLPSLVAAVILAAIVVFNFQNFEVVFRDLSIAAAALALAMMNFRSTPNQRKIEPMS